MEVSHTRWRLLLLHGADLHSLQIKSRLEDPLLQRHSVGVNHAQAIKMEVLLLREELEACESNAITVVDHKHTHYDTPVLRAEYEEYKRRQAALSVARGHHGDREENGEENEDLQ